MTARTQSDDPQAQREPARGISRRVLLTGAATAALTLATRPAAQAGTMITPRSAQRRARVGLARDPRVFDAGGRLATAGVRALLDRALGAALDARDAAGGLARLFSPADVVGIKVNCLAGRGLSTHPELVDALIAALIGAGVRADQIVVWDRSDADLRRARYTIRRAGPGPLTYGTNDDYERDPIDAGSVGGCLSRILTRKVTAVINVPVLKDHDLAGISGALKSFYGAIHNPNKCHDNNCNPFIADLYGHAAVRGKVRLTLLDALVGQYHGGPAYSPGHAWKMGALLASTDPVAVDARALDLITRKRAAAGMESLEKAGRGPLWLAEAARRGLGQADPARIEEVAR